MMTSERIIEVDRDWFYKLKDYLQPEERWSKVLPQGNGLILFSFDFDSGENRQLQFVAKAKHD